MASRFDIEIQLHFEGRQFASDERLVDSRKVLKLLDILETAVYDSDRSDVDLVARAFPTDIRPLVRDACLERLRHYRHQRLLLEEARPGSLALIGLIAGISYFVIEKTVGESFAEGYRDSEFHRRLKEFFRRLIDEKALKIAESIRRLLKSRKLQAQVRALPATDESPNIIVIDIPPDQTLEGRQEPQPLGEALNDRL